MPASAASEWDLTVWGCRGSVTVCGPEHVKYGGHTTCLELNLADARIIIDAGSGLAEMGRERKPDGKPALLLFSHLHWDHIVGFPHFSHLFVPGWTLDIRGVPRDGKTVVEAVMDINRPPIFPVDLATTVQVDFSHTPLERSGELDFHSAKVRWMEVTHPGGCSAFSLEVGGKKLVFSGDLELEQTDQDALRSFVRGADIFICDSQYNSLEYPRHVGWGHSTHLHSASFAASADVGQLILTHHDPRHGDDALDEMVEESKKIFANTVAAHDSMVAASGE